MLDGKYKMVWMCPMYADWKNIVHRSKNLKLRNRYLCYTDVTICEEWKYFSNFRDWVLNIQPNKNWENCELDKDLLSKSNRLYSADTCCYIPRELNVFLTDNGRRNEYMLGVSLCKLKFGYKFKAMCNSKVVGYSSIEKEYLGIFHTELEAHKAWQAKKHEYACILAEQQQDPRVAEALRQRYAPDKDLTNR